MFLYFPDSDGPIRLLPAGAAVEALRADVDPREVILLSWLLAHVELEEWEQRVPRLLDVPVTGLRSDAPSHRASL